MTSATAPIAKLARIFRDAPASVAALLALCLFVVWSADQAGYPVTHWAPGGLVALALLAIAVVTVPPRLSELSRPVLVALACLALFTALSFLSILWAGDGADAWEGANRTLLYGLVFALFALWPRRGQSAALLLAVWVLAMVALATFVMLHLDTRASLVGFFKGDRLSYPGDYENANAATWGIAMWPALMLAAARELPWALRGLLAGGTVLLADLALLSQSRGFLYATPMMLVLIFALWPRRLRTFAVLMPVAIAIALTVKPLLHVGDRLSGGGDAVGALHHAVAVTFVAALAVTAVVALGAAIESRRSFSPGFARGAQRALALTAMAALVGVLAGGWVAVGDPLARARHGWDTFTSGRGYGANGSGNRLVSGLGSYRYDFYKVAWHEFTAHPLLGVGVDNFQQQYLLRGHSTETPRYPHSVEMRTLMQTGLPGALLALVGLGAALLAAARAMRARARPDGPAYADQLAPAVAAAALAGFAYWVLHGSFDWFWEFAGLGAPAFALLGLACSLAPTRQGAMVSPVPSESPADLLAGTRRARALRRPGLMRVAAAVLALAAVASLAAPWLSQLQVQYAARVWTRAPGVAYSSLEDAASLNPLSDAPYVLAGSIALRFGDLSRADHEFSLALGRNEGDAYATLERGAIASFRGERARALPLLEAALRLNPRDPITQHVVLVARRGGRVDIGQLNRSILLESRRLT